MSQDESSPAVRIEVMPSAYLDYKLYFKALYEERKARTSPYSYQTFADELGFGETTIMHQVIKGYRPLSVKAAKGLVKYLGLPKGEEAYLFALVEFGNSKTNAKREESFQRLQTVKQNLLPTELDKDMLEYFSRWFHPVIWELVGTSDFQPKIEWIQKKIRTPLKPKDIEESLVLLERLDFIRWNEERTLVVQSKNRISTGPRIKGMALVSYHKEMIANAVEALTNVSGKRRDVSSITLKVTDENAQRLREMIHNFQLQLLDEAERSGEGDQVYQINIQLFPFTN